MSNTRKIIRAFLGSPGDLQEERRAIREVVNEFNDSWASTLGYQVELIGWEETVPGFGRPQHLINKDLDRCDLFIGMIWKRWGTPPDIDGQYSSGFEEEFNRSIMRSEKNGTPEISLFFKKIPTEFMIDPGEDLKKVVDFREKVIKDKKILFQSFSDARELETLVRKSITFFVNRIKAEAELAEPDDLQVKHARTNLAEPTDSQREGNGSPLSSEGFKYLNDFVGRIGQSNSLDVLSSSDIARFRLLANSISKYGNDALYLGGHDANILFHESLKGMVLGQAEKRSLLRLGFQHITSQNIPLWRWYSELVKSEFNPAIVFSFIEVDENEKIGAISVLTSLDIELPNKGVISRNKIISAWFSEAAPSRVRAAALGYLARLGTYADLEVVKSEYDKNDYGTSRSALECMVSILLRTGKTKAALQLFVESQFEYINSELLALVLSRFDELEIPALLLGLEHRNFQVRLRVLNILNSRGEINIGMAERLIEDGNPAVRFEAIKILLSFGKTKTEEEVKQILTAPKHQSTPSLLGALSRTSETGEELFQKYQFNALKNLSESELNKNNDASLIYDDAAYFSLAERFFKRHSKQLRSDIDDKFKGYFEDRIRRIEVVFGESVMRDVIKSARDMEEYIRVDLTRRALNLLCLKQMPEDLNRIRSNLRDAYTGASTLDAKYLARCGEWLDIPLLVNSPKPKRVSTLLMTSGESRLEYEVALAIISIGKKYSISDILSLEMPENYLKATIERCAESQFSKISQKVLFSLLNHESDSVRKATAIMAVRSFPAKKIKLILHDYVVSTSYRYYNVIHWLDLGASMPRADVKKVTRDYITRVT